MVVFASASTTVKIHDFPTGNVIHNYQPTLPIRLSSPDSNGLIRSLTWSKYGQWLALVPDAGRAEIICFKEDSMRLMQTVYEVDDPTCASFERSTFTNIIIGSRSGDLVVYDIQAQSLKRRYRYNTGSAITMVDSTAKDHNVAIVCANGQAYFFSNVCRGYRKCFKISRHQNISVIRANPLESNNVFVGNRSGRVALYDLYSHTKTFVANEHEADVLAVAYSPINSDFLVSVGLDKQFCFYDIRAQNKCIVKRSMANFLTAIDTSPDANFVVIGCEKGQIYIYDVRRTQEPYNSFAAHDAYVDHVPFRKFTEYVYW